MFDLFTIVLAKEPYQNSDFQNKNITHPISLAAKWVLSLKQHVYALGPRLGIIHKNVHNIFMKISKLLQYETSRDILWKIW